MLQDTGIRFVYSGFTCRLLVGRYIQGQSPALVVANDDTPDEVVAYATINIPDYATERRTFGENAMFFQCQDAYAGLVGILHEHGAISAPVGRLTFEDVGETYLICHVLVDVPPLP